MSLGHLLGVGKASTTYIPRTEEGAEEPPITGVQLVGQQPVLLMTSPNWEGESRKIGDIKQVKTTGLGY